MPDDPGAARLVALEGLSGVGKTTIGRALAERWSGAVFLPEAYDGMRRPPSLAVPDRSALMVTELALLRAERTRYRRAVGWRAAGRPVVADTGFLGPLTYSRGLADLDPSRNVVGDLGARYGRLARALALGVPDLTVRLELPAPIRRRRLDQDPIGHPEALRSRHAAVGRIERRLWRGPLTGVLGGRVVAVSALGTPAAVAHRIVRRLAAGAGAPALGRALAARCLAGAVAQLAPVTVKK